MRLATDPVVGVRHIKLMISSVRLTMTQILSGVQGSQVAPLLTPRLLSQTPWGMEESHCVSTHSPEPQSACALPVQPGSTSATAR